MNVHVKYTVIIPRVLSLLKHKWEQFYKLAMHCFKRKFQSTTLTDITEVGSLAPGKPSWWQATWFGYKL